MVKIDVTFGCGCGKPKPGVGGAPITPPSK